MANSPALKIISAGHSERAAGGSLGGSLLTMKQNGINPGIENIRIRRGERQQ